MIVPKIAEGGIMLLLLGAYTWRKGHDYFIVSLLLRYTETLLREFPKKESEKKNKDHILKRRFPVTISNNVMIHIFPLFYCLASMEIVALISL